MLPPTSTATGYLEICKYMVNGYHKILIRDAIFISQANVNTQLIQYKSYVHT